MSYSDYIYQEPVNTNDATRFVETMRLSTADIREGVLALKAERDQLKADLALATVREAALREGLENFRGVDLADLEACAGCEYRAGVWKLCSYHEGQADMCGAIDVEALLADPSPAAERLLRIEAAARAMLACDCDDLPFDCPHRELLREALADMEANRG